MQHKDQCYIQALLKNDNRLIQEIYNDNIKQVQSWVKYNNGTIADAEDVFQEALLAIYTSAAKGDFNLTVPIGALLLRICKNKWIDYLRKKKRSPEVRIEDEERLKDTQALFELAIEVEENAREDLIKKQCFEQLSELCRSLFQFLISGLKPAEIAKQLNMSNANSVYRRKKACSDRWKKLYQERVK